MNFPLSPAPAAQPETAPEAVTVARMLVIYPDGTSAQTTRAALGSTIVSSGFTLEQAADYDGTSVWDVVDAQGAAAAFPLAAPAAALRCYAHFIETYLDDDPTFDYSEWRAAIAQARTDADTLDAGGAAR